ncbi:MAG TPA: hypothetical protein VIB48_07020 [Acidimicrobiia bacterium]
MDEREAERLAQLMVTFLETGTPPEGLFRPDVFCDFTLPHWRMQARGIEDVAGVRKAGHPGPSTVTRRRVDPLPNGFVIEFEERWDDAGAGWYSREMIRCDVVDGSIAELSVYCTGDWDEARQAEHAQAVRLIKA